VELVDESGNPVSRDELQAELGQQEQVGGTVVAEPTGQSPVDGEAGERRSKDVRVEEEPPVEAES
jgi:hypothetical protein